MTETFKAHSWFRNTHLQTCLPTFLSRIKPLLPFSLEPVHLPDGDVIEVGRLGSFDAPPILLMPGLEGDLTSPYIQSVGSALSEMGWQVLVMHYRTCGNTQNFQPRSYNAYCIKDLQFLLNDIQQRFNLKPEVAIGFSMGGNLLLHYARQYPDAFKQIITISTPFDMHETVKHLPRLYEKMFLDTFKDKTLKKMKAGVSLPVNKQELKKIKTLIDYDHLFTAPIFGHASAQDYYEHSSCAPFLSEITTPTHMIFAEDDPFIPSHSIPRDIDSPHITLEMHQEGGHVGFFAHKNNDGNRFWLAHRIVHLLKNDFCDAIS
jgi:predicted alpha/beta-fold hydrolase